MVLQGQMFNKQHSQMSSGRPKAPRVSTFTPSNQRTTQFKTPNLQNELVQSTHIATSTGTSNNLNNRFQLHNNVNMHIHTSPTILPSNIATTMGFRKELVKPTLTVNKPPLTRQSVVPYKELTPMSKPVEIIINTNIKKINIFSKRFTAFSANNLATILKSYNIEVNVYLRDIYKEDIEACNNDINLYVFIFGPQWNLARPGKDIIPLPKNRYFLYQLEQLNQTEQAYQNVDIIINNIRDSYCTFDYSKTNIAYYPQDIRDKIILLAPFISNPYTNIKEKSIDILFIGTINDRRRKILQNLKSRALWGDKDYTIEFVEKIFEDRLDALIRKSKIVINLHYYPNAIMELFRIHDILPYDCKIISEAGTGSSNSDPDGIIDKYKDFVTFFPVIKR